jgi:hypothetical protein
MENLLDPFDLLDFCLMLLATIAPIFIAYKVRRKNRSLLALAVLLASFTVSHSLYHLSLYLGLDYLAAILFWPLGALLLLAFGIYYWKVGV